MVDTEPEAESDLRRRAAWLLVTLAVAAVLLVVVISALAKTDHGGSSNGGRRPLDSAASRQPATSTSPHARKHHRHRPARRTSPALTSSAPPVGTTSCPTDETCILSGDVGNGVAAVNAYRTAHGKPAVPGTVSVAAQTCAVHNGSGCTGGWAETEIANPDGTEAVDKLTDLAKFLDPQMTDFEVGWAYDPHAHLYYFAFIRND